ncbi:MAG: hypothetical protein ACOX80_07415 [Methanomassiliicoccaceae archaeon]|jgi:hypothetical protein|nr:hypothetical protein [Euryarchaeota archaeon]
MSQDGKTFNLRNIDGQTVGIVTIALGFALLIAFYVVRESIYLMIPVIMLEIGIYGMALGAFSYLRGPRTSGRWGNDSVYSLFWGSMIAVIGGMWIAYDRLADAYALPAFIAAFLFYFGATMLILNRNKTVKSRVW